MSIDFRNGKRKGWGSKEKHTLANRKSSVFGVCIEGIIVASPGGAGLIEEVREVVPQARAAEQLREGVGALLQAQVALGGLERGHEVDLRADSFKI